MARGGTEMQLSVTKMELPVAPAVKPADIVLAMRMRTVPDGSGPAFPPEFHFSPIDGAPLQPACLADAVWVPPSGARTTNIPDANKATGLKQTTEAIDSALLQRRLADGEPGREMPLPPPGAYEFFCARFGTQASVLLAVDTAKGTLFAWLPASESWQALSGEDSLLSESTLPHWAWRAELADQFNSCLFLPTDKGLALVMPDFASLTYRVAYVCEGAALAAPIAFRGKVWAPVADRHGMIQIVNVDDDGVAGDPLVLDNVQDLGVVSAPVAYGRLAVWPCSKGQIRLQVGTDGNFSASFIPWAPDITPHFEFGTPYLSASGVLWQLCLSSTSDMFVYVQLGSAKPEQVEALTPRLCSGTVNYRFRNMQPGDPWLEPETGDDGAANTVGYPLLELAGGGMLVLRVANPSGLTELLNSGERMRAELVYEDNRSDSIIDVVSITRPWDLRLFFYQGALWAYHPAMKRMIGWTVQA